MLIVENFAHQNESLILYSSFCWFLLFLSSRFISSTFIKSYQKLTKVKKIDWNIRVVSFFHSLIAVSLCFSLLNDDNLNNDKINGYSVYSNQMILISAGYFLWDCIISIITVMDGGIGFVIHGVVCLLLLLCSLVYIIY